MGRELLVMISDAVFSPFSSYQQGASNDSQGSVLLHPPHHVWQKSLCRKGAIDDVGYFPPRPLHKSLSELEDH